MSAAVCTLFEGTYHPGLGALVNSLYRGGYRGTVWVGYRGALPPWAQSLRTTNHYQEMHVAEGCVLRFVPVATDYHLTNYKPDFMLSLWANHCPEADALFYFDPDIVVKAEWRFFTDWAKHGIALCEDVNSPVYRRHPRREAWRQHFAQHPIDLGADLDIYFNAGFVGLSRADQDFLTDWMRISQWMAPAVGGLENSKLTDQRAGIAPKTVAKPFYFDCTDQDSFNVTAMVHAQRLSPVGKEGMDFTHGGTLMAHAIGASKPWNRPLVKMALRGYGVRSVDKLFWANVSTPLTLFSPRQVQRQRVALQMASAIARLNNR